MTCSKFYKVVYVSNLLVLRTSLRGRSLPDTCAARQCGEQSLILLEIASSQRTRALLAMTTKLSKVTNLLKLEIFRNSRRDL